MSGIFAVTSMDRLLTLSNPERMSLITPKQAWFAVAITVVVSVGLTLSWSLDIGLTYDPIMQVFKCWKVHDSNVWSLVSVIFYHGKLIQILFVS